MNFGVLLQGQAADELHREEWLRPKAGIGGTGLVDLSDARVLQTSQRLRFLPESAQSIGGGQAELDHLQSDNAAWFFLFSFVDRAHATFAEQPNNAIAANGRRVRRRVPDPESVARSLAATSRAGASRKFSVSRACASSDSTSRRSDSSPSQACSMKAALPLPRLLQRRMV